MHYVVSCDPAVQLVGKYNGKVFEDREVTFDYGEGDFIG